MVPERVAGIGAGPARLTAAYPLSKEHVPAIVLESAPQYVGGLVQTVRYKRLLFRYRRPSLLFQVPTSRGPVERNPSKDLLDRPRSSPMFYRGKF